MLVSIQSMANSFMVMNPDVSFQFCADDPVEGMIIVCIILCQPLLAPYYTLIVECLREDVQPRKSNTINDAKATRKRRKNAGPLCLPIILAVLANECVFDFHSFFCHDRFR